MSPVDIVESHDVIFTEIAANLNLDQFQRDFTRIGKAVNAPDRDVYRSWASKRPPQFTRLERDA